MEVRGGAESRRAGSGERGAARSGRMDRRTDAHPPRPAAFCGALGWNSAGRETGSVPALGEGEKAGEGGVGVFSLELPKNCKTRYMCHLPKIMFIRG